MGNNSASENPKLTAKEDKDKVFLLFQDTFGPSECNVMIEKVESHLRRMWAVQIGSSANGRYADSFHDSALLVQLWRKIRPLVPAVFDGRPLAGLHPDIRVMKYTEGGHGVPHRDTKVVYMFDCEQRAETGVLSESKSDQANWSCASGACESCLTAFVYLNDDFKGGFTRFFPSRYSDKYPHLPDPSYHDLSGNLPKAAQTCAVDIVPKQGTLSVFQQVGRETEEMD